jgi:hypothetical protein
MLSIKNLQNLLKVSQKQVTTGLILSLSLLTGLLFEINLKAFEASSTDTNTEAKPEAKPVGRWESPSMRRRREAEETARLTAAVSAVSFEKTSEVAVPAPVPSEAMVRPLDELTTGFAAITESPRGISFSSDASPLDPSSARGSHRSSLRSSTTPKECKRVSFDEKPEIREYDPQSLTYREELNIRLAIQAEAAAREQRIADARRTADADEIAKLGRMIRRKQTKIKF